MTVKIALYQEAWESHVDRCDRCSWVTLDFCQVGRKLRDAWSQAAAAAMVPIPVIQRGTAKA